MNDTFCATRADKVWLSKIYMVTGSVPIHAKYMHRIYGTHFLKGVDHDCPRGWTMAFEIVGAVHVFAGITTFEQNCIFPAQVVFGSRCFVNQQGV